MSDPTPAGTAAPKALARLAKRQSRVSELTMIAPLKPGGADRLRAKLAGPLGAQIPAAGEHLGTVHDLRLVIFDDDARLLFCIAYDALWAPHIDDFAAPARVHPVVELIDSFFEEVEGWPGVLDPSVKDFVARYQLTADAWYCAYPDATVKDIRRGQRIAEAYNGLLKAAQG
jgi:hypothetical protein